MQSVYFLMKKAENLMWNHIDNLKIHWNWRRASKARANEWMGMACKGEVWGIKRERGNGRTQDKEERERESSKVRALGFKNAYRLERANRIKDWEKISKFKK